ncbi:MAG: alpha/beta hydrolase [Proteobacteria bacterium]|nr:alpha/beta hydrolase [Pseudomonadota bacterium]
MSIAAGISIGLALGLTLAVLGLWAWLRGPDIPYQELEARYASKGSAYVDLPGGVHLHYRASGDAAAPVLVLVHGYGDSFTSWDGWTEVLATKFRVLSVDLPGHGLTRAPDGYALSSDSYVDLLEAFAAQLGLPKFALAGNSMGGGVAWRYAVSHAERLSALVLVDAAGWPLAAPKELPLAFRILQYRAGRWLLAHIDNRPLIEQGLKQDVYDPAVIADAFVDRWAALQRAPGHRAILMSANPSSFTSASDELLSVIHVPTLVLHGESDTLIPIAAGRRFAAAIAGARLLSYPNVGHLPQVEIPARSAADVGAFLEALQAGTP